MEILNDKEKKLELEYPTLWSYKVIGFEKKSIISAIKDIILEKDHTLKHSKKSKGGKYISMNLETLVMNEDERNYIFQSLKSHSDIKMVL